MLPEELCPLFWLSSETITSVALFCSVPLRSQQLREADSCCFPPSQPGLVWHMGLVPLTTYPLFLSYVGSLRDSVTRQLQVPAQSLSTWEVSGRSLNSANFSFFIQKGVYDYTLLDLKWITNKDLLLLSRFKSCPTLCDSIDGSPPGSPVPEILQARTLEWVAISFFSSWKWKVKVKSLSCGQLSATPWTAAYQAPPSMGFSRQEYWSGVPLPTGAQKTIVSVVQHRGISVGSGHSTGNSAQYYVTT